MYIHGWAALRCWDIYATKGGFAHAGPCAYISIRSFSLSVCVCAANTGKHHRSSAAHLYIQYRKVGGGLTYFHFDMMGGGAYAYNQMWAATALVCLPLPQLRFSMIQFIHNILTQPSAYRWLEQISATKSDPIIFRNSKRGSIRTWNDYRFCRKKIFQKSIFTIDPGIINFDLFIWFIFRIFY